MLIDDLHPWQSDIVELVKLAAYHLSKGTAFDNRIAFLLFDVSVESIFKTYLTLPDEITHTSISYHKRKDATQGNFHILVRAVKEAAPSVEDTEILHVQYFHDQRNKLYHQGTGITISQQNATSYGQLVVTMLDKLLSVDLSGMLITRTEVKTDAQQIVDRWQTEIDDFQDVVYQVIENIEPKLLYPSSQRRLKSLSKNEVDSGFSSQEDGYRQFIDEFIENPQIKSWLIELVDPSVSIALASRNLSTMMDWLEDPVYLCLLIIGAFPIPEDDFDTSWLNADEELEIVENIVDHVINIYSSAKTYIGFLDMTVKGKMLPSANLDVVKAMVKAGDEQFELLRAKQDVLSEWLTRKSS